MFFFDHFESVNWTSLAINDVLPIKLNRIDTWKIEVINNSGILFALTNLLTIDEIKRANSYHQVKDKNRFITSRAYLRILLEKYLITPAKEIIFKKGENKKPFISNDTGSVYYNVSHSGSLILISISAKDVGVDIEETTERFDFTEVLSTAFSKEEREYIMSSKKQNYFFYQLWTRKESLLKATGEGLNDQLALVPSLNGLYCNNDSVLNSKGSWSIYSFDINSNYVGSIAHQTENVPFNFYTLKNE